MSVYASKRGVWLDRLGSFPGNAPDWDRLRRYADVVYLNPEDPLVTAEAMSTVRLHGFVAGITAVPRTPDAVVFAQTIDNNLARLDPRNTGSPVMVDVEVHDAAWIRLWLSQYRGLRPGRATDFTLEPYQDGWWNAPVGGTVYADLLAARMDIFPQLYSTVAGVDMVPADPRRVERFLRDALVPWERWHFMYDGIRASLDAEDGCCFTAERMHQAGLI